MQSDIVRLLTQSDTGDPQPQKPVYPVLPVAGGKRTNSHRQNIDHEGRHAIQITWVCTWDESLSHPESVGKGERGGRGEERRGERGRGEKGEREEGEGEGRRMEREEEREG
jgi:hypothetical protein